MAPLEMKEGTTLGEKYNQPLKAAVLKGPASDLYLYLIS
jgi:hypothetical protein